MLPDPVPLRSAHHLIARHLIDGGDPRCRHTVTALTRRHALIGASALALGAAAGCRGDADQPAESPGGRTVQTSPFGFRLHPLHVLVGLLILGLFGIGAGALSYSLAIISRKSEWMFWAVQQSVTFPLLLLSGMMLPLETGPGWMRVAAAFNPLTYVVEAERALFAGRFVDPAVLPGVVAAVVTCGVGVTIGIVAIRGATR